MVEITPQSAPPPSPPRGNGNQEAPAFDSALRECRPSDSALATQSNPTAGGQTTSTGLPQSQFFYAGPNGAGGSGTTAAAGPKQVVQTTNKSGGTTVKLQDFKPPGWEAANDDPAACYRLANEGASKTTRAGETPTGGGGVILYDDKTNLGSDIIKKPAQRIHTDKDASAVAVEQIKRHIDSGRAVVAGVSEPTSGKVVAGPRMENGKEIAGKQPVTDHYVAINGYETDASGKIVALYARDNAVSKTEEVRFEVGADGSITKPKDAKRDDYIGMEYQLSEVRFHTGFEYAGDLRPTNDADKGMVWPQPI